MSNQDALIVEAWKATIDVQKHFNDLGLRIRNFALTLIVGVLGATSFALKEDFQFLFFKVRIPAGELILFSGLIGWAGLYLMDRHWYHRLLRGAVSHGTKIENALKERMPELMLTHEITDKSRISFSRRSAVIWVIGLELALMFLMTMFYKLKNVVTPDHVWFFYIASPIAALVAGIYVGVRMPARGIKITAAHRLDVFYFGGAAALILVMLGQFALVAPDRVDDRVQDSRGEKSVMPGKGAGGRAPLTSNKLRPKGKVVGGGE